MKHPHWITLYTSTVSLLGIAILVKTCLSLPEDRTGILAFALAGALTELFSVQLFQSGRDTRISVSFVLAIAGIIAIGPAAGILTQAISGLTTMVTTSISSSRQSGGRVNLIRRGAFNMGMFVTSAAAAGWVYQTFSKLIPNPLPSLIFSLILTVTVSELANAILLMTVIVFQTGQKRSVIWKRDFQWGLQISIVIGVIYGGALAIAYRMFAIPGLLVFLMPVLLTSYSFRLYVRNMKDYVDKLEAANRALDEINLDLLETLGAVIDAYDVYTYGHSTQVAVYAGAIAEKMNIGVKEKENLLRAALVHDIGKIGVMDRIISKQGELTDDERRSICYHPTIGAEIISRMKGLEDLIPLVLCHHEQWDGHGYPCGLVAEAIPLEARILSVADSMDAMLSDRPYRPTLPLKDVREELIRCSGSQFDPRVASAALQLLDEKGPAFFKNSANTVDQNVVSRKLGTVFGWSRYMKKSVVLERQGHLPDNLRR